MNIVGIVSWVLVFVCGASLLHTPGQELWGVFFIAVCGFALGVLVSHRP